MKAFIANLKRAISDGETVSIGGGEFGAAELRELLAALEHVPRFPVGTHFKDPRRKHAYMETVVDFHTTRNLNGDVVRTAYVASHEFCGQTVLTRDICETTIARNLIKE